MAINSAGVAGTYLTRSSTSVPPIASWSFSCDVMITGDSPGGRHMLVFFGAAYQVRITSGDLLNLRNSGSEASGATTLTRNRWYSVGAVVSGTGTGQFVGYLDGLTQVIHNGDALISSGDWLIGGNSFDENLNGRLANYKIWGAALTPDEMFRESRQASPVRTKDLVGYYPFTSKAALEVDMSARHIPLVITGTGYASVESPAKPPIVGTRRRLGDVFAGGGGPTAFPHHYYQLMRA